MDRKQLKAFVKAYFTIYFDGKTDVPSHIQIDGESKPLDYYIRNLMREYMYETYGMVPRPNAKSPEYTLMFEELWEDYMMAIHAQEKLGSTTARFGLYANFGNHIAKMNAGRRLALEKRTSNKRRKL